MNLLILGDDISSQRRLAEEVSRLGHKATVFQDWSLALDFLDGHGPVDVIVAELESPGGGPNGVSFARMSRLRRPGVRILFVGETEAVAREVDPKLGPVVLKREGLGRVVDLIRAMETADDEGAPRQSNTFNSQGEPTPL